MIPALSVPDGTSTIWHRLQLAPTAVTAGARRAQIRQRIAATIDDRDYMVNPARVDVATADPEAGGAGSPMHLPTQGR